MGRPPHGGDAQRRHYTRRSRRCRRVGLEVDIPSLIDQRWLVVWAITAVVISRVLVVSGIGSAAQFVGEPTRAELLRAHRAAVGL